MLALDADPIEYLPSRKALKFMSRQDRLAVAAAGRALADAGLIGSPEADPVDVFLCVGYIPFSREEAAILSARSRDDDGHFSMALFSTEAYRSINPIRAFTCLPNMSAHHLAASFGLQGEYLITTPEQPSSIWPSMKPFIG